MDGPQRVGGNRPSRTPIRKFWLVLAPQGREHAWGSQHSPDTHSFSHFAHGKQSNYSDWDFVAGFVVSWSQLLVKKENMFLTICILGRSNLLSPRIPRGPLTDNWDHNCCLRSIFSNDGSCRGELQGRCSCLNP